MVQWTCISGRSKLGRSKRGRTGDERGRTMPSAGLKRPGRTTYQDKKTVSAHGAVYGLFLSPKTRGA